MSNFNFPAHGPSTAFSSHYPHHDSNPQESHNLRPIDIDYDQSYSINRLLDEIPDFRARWILLGDTPADAKNRGHRAALGTRVKRLKAMIDA